MLSGEAANTHFIVFDSIWAWSHNTRGKHTYHYTTDVYLFWGDLSLIPQHSRQAHLPLHHWCLFALRRSELDPATLEASTLTITPLMFICFEEIWAWSHNTRGKHIYHYTTDVYLFWRDLFPLYCTYNSLKRYFYYFYFIFNPHRIQTRK